MDHILPPALRCLFQREALLTPTVSDRDTDQHTQKAATDTMQHNTDLYYRITAILPEATFGEDNDGQLIIYTNLREDAFGNITHTLTVDRPVEALTLSVEGDVETFDTAGVVALGCNIHDTMSGFVVVSATPFFARTDAQGRVSVAGVPAGARMPTQLVNA